MLKQRGEKTADGKWSIPAAERNKDPILGVLARVLPSRGLVLEVASGTGQHVMHFAGALSHLTWQPSDPDAELRESIALRVREEQRANVNRAIGLDVTIYNPNLDPARTAARDLVHRLIRALTSS